MEGGCGCPQLGTEGALLDAGDGAQPSRRSANFRPQSSQGQPALAISHCSSLPFPLPSRSGMVRLRPAVSFPATPPCVYNRSVATRAASFTPPTCHCPLAPLIVLCFYRPHLGLGCLQTVAGHANFRDGWHNFQDLHHSYDVRVIRHGL